MPEETLKINDGVLETLDCTPNDSVWNLTSRQRALGRAVTMNILKREDYNELDLGSSEVEMNQLLLNAESARDLAKDCFWALFQNNPEYAEPTPPYRTISDKIMRWVEKSALWEKNRINAVNSIAISSISAGLLFSLLMNDDTLKEALKEQEKLNKQIQEASNKLSENPQSDEEAPGGQGDQNPDSKNDQSEKQKASQQIADALAKLNQLGDEIDKHLGTNKAEAVRANAIKEAGEEGEKASALMSGFGLNGNSVTGSDLKNLMSFYDEIKNKRDIQKLVECIGRARDIATEGIISKRKAGETETLVDSDYTRDFINIFPSERFLLRQDIHPAIRAQKLCEYADHGLLGMIHGEKLENHGSLIVGVDISSSMSTMMRSMNLSKVDFARALAMGIATAAKNSGQPVEIFMFNTEPISEAVLNNESTIPDLYDFLDISCKGGTRINRAIEHACGRVLSMGEKTENTDIVLITDAEDSFDPDIEKLNDIKSEWGTRLITLGINIAQSYNDLKKVSDAFIEINGTEDFDNIAQKLARELR